MITTTISSSKDKIIKLLSENTSLSAKQVYLRLRRQFGVTNSYQAVHKTIKQMVESKILVKNENFYNISSEWVEYLKKHVQDLESKLLSENNRINLEELNNGQSLHLSFNGILDVGWFLIDKLMNAPAKLGVPSLALWRFCYSIIGLDSKYLERLQEVANKTKWLILVEENNPVDWMFGDLLKSYSAFEIRYGIKCATKLSDKMICGDYVAEIIYPSYFRKIWEIQNKLPVKIVQFNLAKHLLLMRDFQPKIDVILTKNKELADEYRKEYFGVSG